MIPQWPKVLALMELIQPRLITPRLCTLIPLLCSDKTLKWHFNKFAPSWTLLDLYAAMTIKLKS